MRRLPGVLGGPEALGAVQTLYDIAIMGFDISRLISSPGPFREKTVEAACWSDAVQPPKSGAESGHKSAKSGQKRRAYRRSTRVRSR